MPCQQKAALHTWGLHGRAGRHLSVTSSTFNSAGFCRGCSGLTNDKILDVLRLISPVLTRFSIAFELPALCSIAVELRRRCSLDPPNPVEDPVFDLCAQERGRERVSEGERKRERERGRERESARESVVVFVVRDTIYLRATFHLTSCGEGFNTVPRRMLPIMAAHPEGWCTPATSTRVPCARKAVSFCLVWGEDKQ